MAPTPEQVTALRDAYGGLARREARAMGEADADATAGRMADWQDTVDLDATLQDRAFAEKRAADEQGLADWSAKVEADRVAQEGGFAVKAARLREARGLPPIAGVPSVAAPLADETVPANMVGSGGEVLALRNANAPKLAAPAIEPGSLLARGLDAITGPAKAAWARANAPIESMRPPNVPPVDAGPPPAPAASPAPPVAPPAVPPPAASAGPAIFAKGAPGGAGGPPGATRGDRAETVAEAIWRERQAELDRLAKGSPYYRIPGSPERELRTDVHRERSLGYDPQILDRQMAIETGPDVLTEEAARPNQAPAVAYDPRVLAAMIAPPPEAKTQKDRDAYYAGLADKASKDRASLQTLLSSGAVKLAAPRADMKPLDDAEALVYSDAHKKAFTAIIEPFASTGVDLRDPENAKLVADADRDAKLAASEALNRSRIMENAKAIDDTNATTRRTFDEQEAMRLRQVEAKRETNREKYGAEGQVGFEKEKLRLEAEGHEATAEAERGMAKIAGDAVEAGKLLRERADKASPGVMQSILGVIGMGLGAFGQGMVGGPNQYMEAAKHRIESQSRQLSDDVAIQKGIEVSRYEQIKHNLQAKLAMGMSENSMNAAKQLLGKVELQQLQAMKELSAATRGSEKTAVKVIPERAASVGGGPASPKKRLETLLAMRADEEKNTDIAKKIEGEGGDGKRPQPPVVRYGGVEMQFRPNLPTDVTSSAMRAMAAANGVKANLAILEKQQQKAGSWTYFSKEAAAEAVMVASQANVMMGGGAMAKDEKEHWVGVLTGARTDEARKSIDRMMDNVVGGHIDAFIAGRVDPKTGRVTPIHQAPHK